MIDTPRTTHTQHSDSPTESDPERPGAVCGPDCDLFQDPTESDTRVDVMAESLTEKIDTTLTAMAELAEELHAVERSAKGTPLGDAIYRFNAFHLGELEGTDHGWLGDYVVDSLRRLRDGDW